MGEGVRRRVRAAERSFVRMDGPGTSEGTPEPPGVGFDAGWRTATPFTGALVTRGSFPLLVRLPVVDGRMRTERPSPTGLPVAVTGRQYLFRWMEMQRPGLCRSATDQEDRSGESTFLSRVCNRPKQPGHH